MMAGLWRRAAALIGVVLLSTASAPPPKLGVLEVDVANVRNARGLIRVDICPKVDFLKACPYSASAPATPGVTRVYVRAVPAGLYAAQAFHDENDNGDVDRGLFGIPKEGVGFSNDAKIRLGPPKFAEAEFQFTGDKQGIAFRLRYFR